jgi:hypothetical protein
LRARVAGFAVVGLLYADWRGSGCRCRLKDSRGGEKDEGEGEEGSREGERGRE